jgi:hypothetical protein
MPFLSLLGLYSIYLMGYLLAVPPSFRILILARSVTVLLPELLLNFAIAMAAARAIVVVVFSIVYFALSNFISLRRQFSTLKKTSVSRVFLFILRCWRLVRSSNFWINACLTPLIFLQIHLGKSVAIEYIASLVSISFLTLIFVFSTFPLLRKVGLLAMLTGSTIPSVIFRNALIATAFAATFSFGQHRMLLAATECVHFLNGRGGYDWYAPIDYIDGSVIGVESISLNSAFSPLFKIRMSVFSYMPISLGSELQDNLGFPSSWRLSDISNSRKFDCSDLGEGPWGP